MKRKRSKLSFGHDNDTGFYSTVSNVWTLRRVGWQDVRVSFGVAQASLRWTVKFFGDVAVMLKDFLVGASRTFESSSTSVGFSIAKKTPKRPVVKRGYPYCICHTPGRADWAHGKKRCWRKR